MSRSLPEDPLIRSLVIQARNAQLSRRTMLQGAGIGAAALTLAACAPAGSSQPTAAPDNSANDPTLTWANWALYIDEDDDGQLPDARPLPGGDRASPSTTRSTSTTTTRTTRRSRTSSRSARTSAPTSSASPTGWSPAGSASVTPRSFDDANIPNRKNLDAEPARPRLRPGPHELPAVAGRLRRHLLEQGEDPRGPQVGLRPVEARAQGPRRRAERDARHHRADHARAGRRHLAATSRDDGVRRRDRRVPSSRSRAARSATSRATRTSTTWPTRTPSRRSSGRATSPRSTSRPATAGASRSRRPAARSGTTTSSSRSARRARRTPRSSSTTTTTPRSRPRSRRG